MSADRLDGLMGLRGTILAAIAAPCDEAHGLYDDHVCICDEVARAAADAIRAALASGDLTPEDLGMVSDDSWTHHPIDDDAECPVTCEYGCYLVHYEDEERASNAVDLYRLPSAPAPWQSLAAAMHAFPSAPASSPRCAPTQGTSDGPRPVAEAP